MVSYLSWTANAVLFAAACFLAANTANTLFASMLAPPEHETIAQTRPKPAAGPSWADRQVILDRNLFHSTTVAQAGTPDPIDEDIEATQLPLRLLGTAAAKVPELAWAAVEDQQSHKTLVVTIGDLLVNQAKVLRIERRRVVLLENGAHRELTFGDEDQSPPPGRSARPTARTPRRRSLAREATRRQPRVQRVAENRFALPRGDVEDALKNPTNILSQARFLPKYEGNQMVGFQVNSIKSGSVLQEFGIKNGDLITEFNGISINSPTESARLLQEFNNSDQVKLVVQGADGQSREINVDLN